MMCHIYIDVDTLYTIYIYKYIKDIIYINTHTQKSNYLHCKTIRREQQKIWHLKFVFVNLVMIDILLI